jgi:hypothetical protein
MRCLQRETSIVRMHRHTKLVNRDLYLWLNSLPEYRKRRRATMQSAVSTIRRPSHRHELIFFFELIWYVEGCMRRAIGPEQPTMKVPNVISCDNDGDCGLTHLASVSSFRLASSTETTLTRNMRVVFLLMLARVVAGGTSIAGFRWIDPKTNKAVKIGQSDLVQDGQFVDLGEVPKGLSMEAITEGDPIGSVRFQIDSLDRVVFVDNTARYFACGNKGTDLAPDVLPCDFVPAPTSITATIYSKPNGTGTVFAERNVIVNFFFLAPPLLSLKLIAPGNPDSPLTNDMAIRLSPTPMLSIRMDYDGYKNWNPQSAVFDYDNRTIFRTENSKPFTLLGDRGAVKYNTFTPTVGRHTLVVTAYSRKSRKGQSTQTSISFSVTK